MNKKTLQKVIDAIKDSKLDYAMGMLDMLMESLPDEKTLVFRPSPLGVAVAETVQETSEADTEADALNKLARSKLESVKQMAGDVQ